jgi:hypothetical protein
MGAPYCPEHGQMTTAWQVNLCQCDRLAWGELSPFR